MIRLKTFLALGDSYTIGEAVEAHLRWPVQLAALLRDVGIPIDDPHIVARTGWTTGELMAGMAAAGLEPGYDIVSLLIGVNNQYRGYPLEPYRSEFKDLLRKAISLAEGKPANVLVLSIPDWGMTPYAVQDPRNPQKIRTEVLAFNKINSSISTAYGVSYLDVFPLSQLAYQDPDLIAQDGLHPSGSQYRLWAKAALPAARRILG